MTPINIMQKLIPEALYNEVHDEIKQDINNLEEYDCNDIGPSENYVMFRSKKHVFSLEPYSRYLSINTLLHCQTGPQYELYAGGLGCGNYIEIRYDLENKEYLVYFLTERTKNLAFHSSVWLEIKQYIADFFIRLQQ